MKIKNRELLRKHGLKTTKQRLCISEILFSGKDMHFSAENLKEILFKKGYKMSLATIYNNLHFLVDAGLLVKRRVENSRTYFDNNTSDHYHLFDEEEDTLIDIPLDKIQFMKLPKIPNDKKIKNINLVINLQKK